MPNPQRLTSRLEIARRAFAAAEFDDALSLVEALPGFDAAALRTTSLLRLGRAQEALESARVAASSRSTDEESVIGESLVAFARVRCGDPDERALRIPPAMPSRAAAAEWAFVASLTAYTLGKYQRAEELLTPAFGVRTPNAHARARNLLGFIRGAQGDVFEQARLFAHTLKAGNVSDVYLRANTVYVLSALARELPLDVSLESLRQAYESIPWTKSIADWRYLAAQNLAWRFALEGAHLQAYRLGMTALELSAPSPAWRVAAHVDFTQIAMAALERISAEYHVERAAELAETVPWAETFEQRTVLLDLAVVYAPTNAARARAFLDRFDGLPPLPEDYILVRDGRLAATRAFAGAMLEREPKRQLELLERAYKVFDGLKHSWRAGCAAVVAWEISKDALWGERAREHVGHFPRSWLGREYFSDDLGDDPRFAKLSPQQRRVVLLLRRRFTDRQIAADLGCSHKTARHHVSAVLKKTGLHSRRELIG